MFITVDCIIFFTVLFLRSIACGVSFTGVIDDEHFNFSSTLILDKTISLSSFKSDEHLFVEISVVNPPDWLFHTISPPSILGAFDTSGSGYGVFQRNSYVYIADGNAGFKAINISDTNNPFVVSAIQTVDARGLWVDESCRYAFVADGEGGLKVIDLSNPSNPSVVSSVGSGVAYDVVVEGLFLYLAETFSGVGVYDISDPRNPLLISRIPTDRAYALHLLTDTKTLYVGDYYGGLKIINVSDPYHPFLQTSYPTDRYISGVFVKDEVAFLVDHVGNLITINVTDPKRPEKMGSVLLDNVFLQGIFVRGKYAYVAAGERGLIICNVSCPSYPEFESSYTQSGYNGLDARSLTVFGDYAFVGDCKRGLRVISISDVANPTQVKLLELSGDARSVFVNENLAFVADHTAGLKVLDVSDKKMIRQLGHIDLVDGANDVSVIDNLAFVGDWIGGLRIIDISNPSDPTEVGYYGIPGETVVNIFLVEENDEVFAFLGCSRFGLRIVDVTIPSSPTLVGSILPPSLPSDSLIHGIFVVGGIAYVADYYGLMVVNVTDRMYPRVVTRLKTNGLSIQVSVERSVSGQFEYVYVCDQYTGLSIYDIREDPFNPSFLGNYITRCRDIYVAGKYAFIASSGLQIFDVSEKSDPKLVETIAGTGASAMGVYVSENYIFTAFGPSGLNVARFGDLDLRGSVPYYATFCSQISLIIEAKDTVGKVLETFSLVFDWKKNEEDCYGHGECRGSRGICECDDRYKPSFDFGPCDEWYCYSIKASSSGVCSGKGDCISPEKCSCRSGYVGYDCSTDLIQYVPIGISSVMIIGILIVMVIMGVCCCCGCIAVCTFICICGCCVTGISLVRTLVKQQKGIRKYKQMDDFDILLKEQLLDKDTSVPHLRINKNLFEIAYDEIKLIEAIGGGGSDSYVFKVRWKGRMAAFKCFNTTLVFKSQNVFDQFEAEVSLLAALSHPGIVSFYGATMKQPRIGILMEYCENGELGQFVQSYRMKQRHIEKEGESGESGGYPISQKFRFCGEICYAMEYIHSRNVIHRDLKSENCLVDSEEQCKLMDFGISRVVKEQDEETKTKRIGTSAYIAPEVLTGKYDQKCDVFSFGILMYVLFSENEQPYGPNRFNIEFSVANNPNFRPKVTDIRKYLGGEDNYEVYEFLSSVMAKCWLADPHDRYSFEDLGEKIEKFSSRFSLDEQRQ